MNLMARTAVNPKVFMIWLPTLVFCMLTGIWALQAQHLLSFIDFVSPLPDIQCAIKAVGFALLSTIAILAVINNGSKSSAPSSIHFPLQILSLMLFGIVMTGYTLFDGLRQSVQNDAYRNLMSIGQLKTEQIGYWMSERQGDVIPHSQNQVFIQALSENSNKGLANSKLLEKVVDKLKTYIEINHYQSITLFDAQGAELITVGADESGSGNIHRLAVKTAIADDRLELVDFHANATSKEGVELGFAAPVKEGGRIMGALYFAVDPVHFLYPLIKQWPVPSVTAETFLFRREGNRVVYLNNSRQIDGKAIAVLQPTEDGLSTQALNQYGVMSGVDYRGIEVLASVHDIPGTPWKMLAKIDQSEAFSTLRRLAAIFLMLVLGLSIASFVSVWFWWRRDKEKAFDEALHERAERGRLLQETVALSEDAILLIDSSVNTFIECNTATTRMLHAASKDEVLSCHPWDISPEYQPDGRLSEEKSAEMNALAEQNKFHRFEWMHRKLDGEIFPVEVTMTPLQLGEKRLLYVVWRDLTESKRAKQSIKRYHRALSMLSAGNRTLVRSTAESEFLDSMCKVAVEVGGYRMAWVGYRVDDAQKTVQPVAQTGFEDGYLERITISWAENEYGQGPAGLAIRTGDTQIIKDIQADPRFEPWRAEAAKRNYSSCIGLPLYFDAQVMGVFMIYAEHTDAFDESELPVLEEMAEDLAYGIMTLRNNVARRQAEQQLDKSYSLLQAAMESTADGILVSALSGEIDSYNRRFADMFNIPPELFASRMALKLAEFIAHLASNASEFLGKIRDISQEPEAVHRYVFDLKDGRSIERITQPQYLNGTVIGRVCCYRDISEQKRHEQQLVYLATHDELTGLPNRNLLNDRLEQGIAHAHRFSSLIAVLFFDMDRFKLINDSLGHDNGDRFLKQVALRLPECIREGDTVARMGGDEFVILLADLFHEDEAATVARTVLDAVSAPYTIDGQELFSSASVGISLYPRDGTDAATLLKRADAAMYHAKEQGGNCLQFVTGEINEQAIRRLDIANKLRYALQRNEMEVFYQPQFCVEQSRIIGSEALIRWKHPELGMVSPAEFIPIAEETGLILDIGAWVVETVCGHVKAWQAADLPKTKVAINLSARQLDLANLPENLAQLLGNAGVEADILELEITEGMVMKQPDKAIQILGELKTMGFSIAIDDFGTGYSSLSYLKRFPIDKLKIDRSFIMDIPEDKDDAAITRAVIAMAHELRLRVVAEGVETDAQLAFLQKYRCDVIQGYLTGRPMPEADFSALLRS